MKIFEKLSQKQVDLHNNRQVTIAFVGDSVTHGCFELYRVNGVDLATVFDMKSAYHAKLKEMLGILFPDVPVNIINAGINGDNAPKALARLERDVLSYKPDMTVVCLGLNDVSKGADAINEYVENLEEIFKQVKASGSELIFMTPNMRNVRVNGRINDDGIRSIAEGIMEADAKQGVMDSYINAARELCKKMDVVVCDCYAIWKLMEKNHINTSLLLSNDVNHPTREMHYLFAYELLKTMMTE